MASPEAKCYTLTDAPPAIQVTPDDPRTARGHDDEESSTVSAIEAGYTAAFATAELPAAQRSIDRIEDKLSVPIGNATEAYETLNAFYTANAATISSAAGALALAVNVDVKSIENTITTFAETSAVMIKGLDALGQLHPFVGVAVTAFKLVITLDLTRRQNNKKVLAVKIQMQDLMTILFQLRHMRDPQEKGPDGTTLADRFSALMESIAKSITACGSACDVYLKKSFLAKTLKSKIYEGRLAGYVTTFANHKKDVGFALKLHTALGVDAANKKLDGQDVHLKVIEEKMEALFRKLDTARERDVQKFIDEQGGAKACVENDGTLQELVSKSGESIAGMDPARAGTGDLALAKTMLNKELAEDVDQAFKKNLKLFDRKLDMQSKQLTDTINLTGEHIISVLSSGAHEKILDVDLQAIWKEQGWKSSVKARHFVLALNDYYTEKFSDIDIAFAESRIGSIAGSAPASPVLSPVLPNGGYAADAKVEDDRWALSYINVAHLQPILEAVDDDGTGFVSIKEANIFAVSRPAGWSLLSWLGFWAAGWHSTVTWYKNRIYRILEAMVSLLEHRVKAANLQSADKYFAGPGVRRVELLLRSTRSAASPVHEHAQLLRLADQYKKSEEDRLHAQLDGLLYEIDDTATLRLITGQGRIERYVYPLVFQLLKRHYDVMRLACVHVLDEGEFDVMATSLATIFKAVDERTQNLEAIFKSTSLNVKERLGHFAFGMFQLTYGEYQRDVINNLILTFDEEGGFEDENEDLGPETDDDEETVNAIFARMSTDVLRYDTEDEAGDIYDFETVHPAPTLPVDPLDGAWTGQMVEDEDGKISTPEGTLAIVLTRTGDKLAGGGESYLGILEIMGTVEEDRKVEITIRWPDGYKAVCTGQYDPDTDTIAGTWDSGDDDDDWSLSSSDIEDAEAESETSSSSDSDNETGDEEGVSDTDDTKESEAAQASGDGAADEEGAVVGDGAEADGKESDWVDEDKTPADDAGPSSSATDEGSESTGPSIIIGRYPFIFRRTPPAAYRFRYTDAQLKENRARARWGFAIAATIDQVQRTRLTWPYLKKRFGEQKRFIELSIRRKTDLQSLTPRTPLNDEETDELIRLRTDLSSCDARFYNSVAEFELRKLIAYSRDCDSCSRHIRSTRLFCIQCIDKLFSDTIDLCSDCIEQTPERDAFVHTRSHVLAKTSRRIHDGEMAWLIPEARVMATRVKKAFKDANSLLSRIEGGAKTGRHANKSRSSHSEKICCCCGEPVSLPCWVCVACVEDTYVCVDCDAKRAPALEDGVSPKHSLTDPLIQILDNEPIPEPVTADGRLAELETKMLGLDSKLASLEEKLESRFGSLEAILQSIADKVSLNN
ncbi:hypothetical protein B0H15DRAFT_836939 [Mycena belliarum]|uniref:EF-hand domain-containing protein n=1 Tax=Mycena belliarum TaxID=1033014 RepID=A0AAD6XRV0_9AGAR|nr:hypothetical protein B0H15DRAFT_836939 [Mycena belliae]